MKYKMASLITYIRPLSQPCAQVIYYTANPKLKNTHVAVVKKAILRRMSLKLKDQIIRMKEID